MYAMLSHACESMGVRPGNGPDMTRDAFTATSIVKANPTPGHTHPDAAAYRTATTETAINISSYIGSSIFVVGLSRSDQRRALRGSRAWYWAKDTNTTNVRDKPLRDDFLYICDVDYYIDMPDLLSKNCHPILIYTVVPEHAAVTGADDTSFHFDEKGLLHSHIAGAGYYEHPLWDYGVDSVMVTRRLFGIFPLSRTVFAVERKQVTQNRQLILLAPIIHFPGILGAFLANWILQTPELKIFNPVIKTTDGSSYARFNVHRRDGMYTTTARVNSFACATVKTVIDDNIACVNRLGKTALMLPTTATWIKDDRSGAAVLTEYHRIATPVKLPHVYPVELGIRGYSYNVDNYHADAKPKLEAFMSPIIHGAFCPIDQKASEERCVQGRITELQKPEPKPNRFRDRCIDEFAELIVNGITLEPVSVDVIIDKQTTAAQKLSIAKASISGDVLKRVVKCFIKTEAYQDIKDPRNITTFNDSQKLDMGMFTLALSEHLKQFKWYGPGKTPLEIAKRMVEICMLAIIMVNISDFARMDGTISKTLRQVDRVIMMKAFIYHRGKLNELLKRSYGNVGFLPHGTTFEQGTTHGSGCPGTSAFQTLRSTFTAFLGFRRQQYVDGVESCPQAAFDALGIHLGDDGADADLRPECHEWAANAVGLVLEASCVQRGHRGINFLARYYSPEIWQGCLDSMCDLKRQVSKFHTTVRLPANIPAEHKLVEKAMAYFASDSNTPIIGDFCRKTLALSKFRPKALLGVGSWWSKFESSEQYPNENVGGWMDAELNLSLPNFDITLFNNWLASTSSASELLSAPLCQEVVPATTGKTPVVVDGDVLLPTAAPPSTPPRTKPQPKTPVKTARKRARKYAQLRTPVAQDGRSRTSKCLVVKFSDGGTKEITRPSVLGSRLRK
jgi:hypothetical protein